MSRMEFNLERKVFTRLLNDADIPFGQNFEGCQVQRRLFDEDVQVLYDKIDRTSKKHEDMKRSLYQKLTRIK